MDDEMMKNEFLAVIYKTRLKLNENSEWRERYKGYAEKISGNIAFIESVRQSFHEWSPLKVYLNTTSAQNAKNSVRFELRYLGQTVANLTGYKNMRHKLSTRDYEEPNRDNFDCNIRLSASDWRGEDATRFRSFFKNRQGPRNAGAKKHNEEHRLQSLLLTEFSKRRNKVIRHIRPVMISGVRFPMPTPISASNHKAVKYSKQYGGGVDILTRTGTGGKATRLCIIELKDENKKAEPPKDVMKQALAYTTFIRELLRSECGSFWWSLFGFTGKVPKPLELYAVCVMRSSQNNDYSFRDMELNIEMDVIKLHYLYFTEENDVIKACNTTLRLK